MIKKGSAAWKGSLKEGTGGISTETGVLRNAPYGFKARFEDGPGTNPEELIAAAHAACFSMALSAGLGKAGFTADSIQTEAAVRLEKVGDGFAITHSDSCASRRCRTSTTRLSRRSPSRPSPAARCRRC